MGEIWGGKGTRGRGRKKAEATRVQRLMKKFIEDVEW